MPPKKRGKIHLVFGPHGDKDSFLVRPVKTPTVLLRERMSELNLYSLDSPAHIIPENRFERLEKRFLDRVLGAGGKAFIGEQPAGIQRAKYARLIRKQHAAGAEFHYEPTFRNFLKYVTAMSAAHAFRDQLLVKNILLFHGRGEEVLARYGSAHSLVSKQLQSRGIRATRDIKNQPMGAWYTIVRKKELGAPISRKELDTAYAETFMESCLYLIKLSSRERMFLHSALSRRALHYDGLHEWVESTSNLAQSDWMESIISPNKLSSPPAMAVGRGLLQKLGFSQEINRTNLLRWLNENSEFWRRDQRARLRERRARMRKR